jgi:hypothetical protein
LRLCFILSLCVSRPTRLLNPTAVAGKRFHIWLRQVVRGYRHSRDRRCPSVNWNGCVFIKESETVRRPAVGSSDWLDGLRSNLTDFFDELRLDPNSIRGVSLFRSFVLCSD